MMALDAHAADLRLVRAVDGFEVNVRSLQGLWTEALYLKLTDQTNHLIEFTDGVIEVLPMPTEQHQAILEFVFLALRSFVDRMGGKVRFAPLRVQVRHNKFREPDILLLCNANDPRRQNRYWLGADLVVEVVSPDDPERDTRVKRADYAEAGIAEYWLVNPEDATISVLTLAGDSYQEHGRFPRGATATSALLSGFTVDVTAVFAAS
jgi:Uma2 family endonuclease